MIDGLVHVHSLYPSPRERGILYHGVVPLSWSAPCVALCGCSSCLSGATRLGQHSSWNLALVMGTCLPRCVAEAWRRIQLQLGCFPSRGSVDSAKCASRDARCVAARRLVLGYVYALAGGTCLLSICGHCNMPRRLPQSLQTPSTGTRFCAALRRWREMLLTAHLPCLA